MILRVMSIGIMGVLSDAGKVSSFELGSMD